MDNPQHSRYPQDTLGCQFLRYPTDQINELVLDHPLPDLRERPQEILPDILLHVFLGLLSVILLLHHHQYLLDSFRFIVLDLLRLDHFLDS